MESACYYTKYQRIRETFRSCRSRDQHAVLNPTRRFLARGGSLDTFVISKTSTQKEDQAVVAQALLLRFFASSFSAVSHMGRGHQLIGVWPESPASAKIKTAKISSVESARFSAKICTSENFPLYGIGHFTVVAHLEHYQGELLLPRMMKHACC